MKMVGVKDGVRVELKRVQRGLNCGVRNRTVRSTDGR